MEVNLSKYCSRCLTMTGLVALCILNKEIVIEGKVIPAAVVLMKKLSTLKMPQVKEKVTYTLIYPQYPRLFMLITRVELW